MYVAKAMQMLADFHVNHLNDAFSITSPLSQRSPQIPETATKRMPQNRHQIAAKRLGLSGHKPGWLEW